MVAQNLKKSAVNLKKMRFWKPENQPETWNSDLTFFFNCPSTNKLNIKLVLNT